MTVPTPEHARSPTKKVEGATRRAKASVLAKSLALTAVVLGALNEPLSVETDLVEEPAERGRVADVCPAPVGGVQPTARFGVLSALKLQHHAQGQDGVEWEELGQGRGRSRPALSLR